MRCQIPSLEAWRARAGECIAILLRFGYDLNCRSEKCGVRRQAQRDAALDVSQTLKFAGKAKKSGVALRLPPHSTSVSAD